MLASLTFAVLTCGGGVLGGVASILIREQILKRKKKRS